MKKNQLSNKTVLFECSLPEIVILRMLRRSQYGQYTIHLQDGTPKRIEAHESTMINHDSIVNELGGNDQEIKRVIKELKLNISKNGEIQ